MLITILMMQVTKAVNVGETVAGNSGKLLFHLFFTLYLLNVVSEDCLLKSMPMLQ